LCALRRRIGYGLPYPAQISAGRTAVPKVTTNGNEISRPIVCDRWLKLKLVI